MHNGFVDCLKKVANKNGNEWREIVQATACQPMSSNNVFVCELILPSSHPHSQIRLSRLLKGEGNPLCGSLSRDFKRFIERGLVQEAFPQQVARVTRRRNMMRYLLFSEKISHLSFLSLLIDQKSNIRNFQRK
jgi:hypothetical protein